MSGANLTGHHDAEVDARLREIIEAWSFINDLPQYAKELHGYGDSNSGFGITYPSDLDEYQREVEGISIPEGMVQAYGCWGPPEGYEFLVAETEYLRVLAEVLFEKGLVDEAVSVKELAALRA